MSGPKYACTFKYTCPSHVLNEHEASACWVDLEDIEVFVFFNTLLHIARFEPFRRAALDDVSERERLATRTCFSWGRHLMQHLLDGREDLILDVPSSKNRFTMTFITKWVRLCDLELSSTDLPECSLSTSDSLETSINRIASLTSSFSTTSTRRRRA